MKRTSFLALALLALSSILAGCATGPSFTEVAANLDPLPAESGRIYFYRSGSPFGAAVQPSVFLNGDKVGSAVPGGVFFEDVPPGNYEVTTETEVERKATFTLARGQTRYVRMEVGFGWLVGRIYPVLVDGSEGESEIQDLAFTGG